MYNDIRFYAYLSILCCFLSNSAFADGWFVVSGSHVLDDYLPKISTYFESISSYQNYVNNYCGESYVTLKSDYVVSVSCNFPDNSLSAGNHSDLSRFHTVYVNLQYVGRLITACRDREYWAVDLLNCKRGVDYE